LLKFKKTAAKVLINSDSIARKTSHGVAKSVQQKEKRHLASINKIP